MAGSDETGRRDSRNSDEECLFGTEPSAFLVEQVIGLGSGTALCIGDGEGRNSVHLAGLGLEVTALDLSPRGSERTRALARERGVEVQAVTCDASDYDLGADRWDLVVSIFAHLPPAVRTDLHMRLPRSLNPGGAFIFEAYRYEKAVCGAGGPSDPERFCDLKKLEREIIGLDVSLAREITRDLDEGSGHVGAAQVVQLVARRRAAWQHLS